MGPAASFSMFSLFPNNSVLVPTFLENSLRPCMSGCNLLCIMWPRYTHYEVAMRRALTRTNLLLESGKVQQLRKTLHSRSNSEAVRRVIEERLAVEAGLGALRTLRELGGPEDVFGRASAKRK